MRRNETGDVMQEFERIAAEKGWITNKREAQDPAPEHIPTHLVKEPHRSALEGMTAPMPAAAKPEVAGTEGHIRRIQSLLANMGPHMRDILATSKAPDGVDGQWGPKTLRALGEAALVFGIPLLKNLVPRLTAAQPGLKTLVDISAALEDFASKRSTPLPAAGKEEMPKEPPAPMHLIKEPHMTQPWQYPTVKELAPKASATIAELLALANDLDDLGETKYAEAVDEHLRLYKAAVDKLYDITGETGEQLIGEAHPGGGPTMAPAKEEGGKVETLVEQQKRDMKVVETKPTGKQAAFLARQLVALANRLDAEGKTEAALLVDKTLAELREGSPRPFVVSGIQKEAIAILVPLIWGLVAAIAATGAVKTAQYLSSRAEGVRKDANDLIKVAADLAKEFPESAALDAASEQLRKVLGPLAENLSDKVPENGSKQEVEQYVAAMYAFEQALPDLRAAVANVKAAVPTGRFQGRLSLDEHFSDLIASFKKNKAAVEALAKYGQKVGKAPAPEAAKEEPAYEKQLRDTLRLSHARFLGTVDKLLGGLVKTLQDPAQEAEANRMLKGKLTETIDWLKGLRQQKEPSSLADRNKLNGYNNILWNSYLGPLRRNPKLADVFASAGNEHIVREAAPPKPAVPGIPGAPVGPLDQPKAPGKTPGKAPAKAPGKGAPRGMGRKARPNLQQLQNAMMAAGIPLPSHQADGKWGPETWRAWNTLRTSIIERKGPGWDIGRPPAPAGNGPSDQAIGAALNMAKHLGRLYSARATVNIAPGIQVPERSLASAQAFIKALLAQPNSGVLSKNSPKENAAIALKLAQAYAQSLERDDSDESWALAREGVAPQARATVMDRLVSQLSSMGTGIPSYRMPGSGQPGYERGERQPYGGEGSEGGIGEFGTLEGRRGGPGSASGERERMPMAMSLEDRVDRVPDVSGFVNDPMQFVAWARRYWMSRDEKEARTGDGYVVAHKVLDQLRGQIANLQNALLTSPVGNRASLQNILRQRHEALNDIYTILPKGR